MKNKIESIVAVGRRKRAVASVWIKKGTGNIEINDRSLTEYFVSAYLQEHAIAPLKHLNCQDQYDLHIRVVGGGIVSQATAVRLGVARALVLEVQERKPKLKPLGFLTRDSREKERKKYGLRKARKSTQYSKR